MRLSTLTTVFSLLSATALGLVYTPCESPSQELQIRNRLALFAQAIDTDNYPLFREVFTPDVNATFDNTGPIYAGLDAIIAAYSPFQNVTTQISIDTIVVNCTIQKAPQSTSYFTATNFFPAMNQLSFNSGKYYDSWVEIGAGVWKIAQRRTNTITGNPYTVNATAGFLGA